MNARASMIHRSNTLVPFFLLSLSLHLLVFFSWPRSARIDAPKGPIPVALLPAPAAPPPERQAEPAPASRRGVTRQAPPRNTKYRVLREEKAPASQPQDEIGEKGEERKVSAPTREARKSDLASRRLPSLKELLPPVTWSSPGEQTGNRNGPIRLDTREARYVSYFETIKRAIERVWVYPEPALQNRLEGKLIVEFTILENGSLIGPRLIRSSGFLELDEEAMRAVRAASPFRPIPPSVSRNRIDILASFEYYDNRLHYHFTR